MGATAASVPLCGQTRGGGGCCLHPPLCTVTSSEKERERERGWRKERLRDSHLERVEGRERERKKEAILVPQWHVCLRFAFFSLVSLLGKTFGEIESGGLI